MEKSWTWADAIFVSLVCGLLAALAIAAHAVLLPVGLWLVG
ncbi:MAG: hypothetical protein QM586_10005 [Xenophilus sp.]